MKIQADMTSNLVMCAVAAVVAVLGFSAFAEDRVKIGDYAKSGRQIDEGNPVKTGDGTKSFWRAIDEDGKPAKTGNGTKKVRRAADEDGIAVKTGDGAKSFWRAIDEDGKPAKTDDGAKKFGRAADELGEPVKTRGAANIPGRALNQKHAKNKAQALKPLE